MPRVIAASQALFGQGEFAAVDERTLDAAKAEIPSLEVYIHGGTVREAVGARANGSGELPSVADLMAETKIVPSKSAARGAIAQGGAYLNNQKVTDVEAKPSPDDLLYGRFLNSASRKAHRGCGRGRRRRPAVRAGVVTSGHCLY
jgi:tyrosyl-tRNA synthetase